MYTNKKASRVIILQNNCNSQEIYLSSYHTSSIIAHFFLLCLNVFCYMSILLISLMPPWLLLGYNDDIMTWFVGPTWGSSGAGRGQAGPMLASWTLLSGNAFHINGLLWGESTSHWGFPHKGTVIICFSSMLSKVSTDFIHTNKGHSPGTGAVEVIWSSHSQRIYPENNG